MLRRRLPLLPICVAASLGLIRCVSRTVPESRFRESRSLNATFPTPTVADPEHFSFAVVGDLHITGGDASRLAKVLDGAKAEGDAFLVLLGDMADQGERSDVVAYRKAVEDAGFSQKTFYVVGNHDVFGDGWASFRDLNGPSHFTFTAGNAKFVALDTADGSLGAEQTAWLEDELAKPRPTHVFLVSHYLPVVPGQRTYLKLADEVEAMRLMKLALTSRVTGWLGAHYHSYIVDKIEGVDYVVAGGGGGRRMDPVKDFFFVQVTVSGTSVSYTMRKFP